MLTKFRLKNFRSFADTGEIEIKPINFLVGANSSGKSSILKFFPLLKQSVGGRPFNGVFRWRGDDVDFGSFSNTVKENETEIEIGLEFCNKAKIIFQIIKSQDYSEKFKSISRFDGANLTVKMTEKELEHAEKNLFLPFTNAKLNNEIDLEIVNLTECTSYVKPIRANIRRSYWLQNDNIEDIFSDGSNLPMFLYSLSEERFASFNNFLNENFGFEVGIRKSEGNLEILISEKNSTSRNAVDMGYGYTELLPILTTIWLNCTQSELIVIEQPEVHLHPKFQSKFAKMLLKVIEKYKNVRFFIETHSETILNTLGREVGYERANPNDINILRIEKQNGISAVKSTGYDNDGYLKDWPINFLDEDAD